MSFQVADILRMNLCLGQSIYDHCCLRPRIRYRVAVAASTVIDAGRFNNPMDIVGIRFRLENGLQ
ncbi:hypothetical protein D3C77_284370 [compost metagenome]